MIQKKKIGIAFSGGGLRSVAHVGVIDALNNAGIKADIVAGTSAGAIVAAFYAAGKTTEQMLGLVKDSNLLKLIQFGLPKTGLTNLSHLHKMLKKHLGIKTFEALNIPCVIPASNLHTGLPVYFSDGDLYAAILASCALPLIFKPIQIDDHLYVDGGLFDNLPSKSIRERCDILIGVNVMPISKPNKIDSMFSIGMRVFDLAIYNNMQSSLDVCDIVIEPMGISRFNVLQFGHSQEAFQIGRKISEDHISRIQNLLT